MFSPQILSFLSLGLASLPIFAAAEPHGKPRNEANSDYETFQQLLQQVDPPSLHAALHNHSPKFKHGMFREDKNAVEFIHRDDASLATSIIKLAKRQENVNGTVTSAIPPTETPSPTVESTTPPASSTDKATDAATVTSEPTPDDRTSQIGASTSIRESTATPNSATLAASITSTRAESTPGATSDVPSLASSTDSPSRSAGSVFTFTDSAGVVVVTTVNGEGTTVATVTPSPSATASESESESESKSTVSSGASIVSKPASRSSVFVRTTTLPNGSKSTITAVTVVPGDDDRATPSGDAGVGTATRSATGATGAPGVQTGVAVRTGSVVKEMLCFVAGVVGVAMLM